MRYQDKVQQLRKIRSRIDWSCVHKINGFSPTISPAPKSTERGEIESIFEGVHYFTQRGIKDLVIQRKYMGSYCDIYLNKNLSDTYFVSRNGYKIDHIDMQEAINACVDLHNKFNWIGLDIVIIQAELMPWGVLGKRLIEKEFGGYLDAHTERFQYLKTSCLENKIAQVSSDVSFGAFDADSRDLTESALKKKYAPHIIRQYKSLQNFRIPDMTNYEDGISVFAKQKYHYAKEGPLYFKPFNVLKMIYTDGREKIPDDNGTYLQVNDDEMKTLHLDTDRDIEEGINDVYKWFDSLTGEMEEGIVIKPLKAFNIGLPPALKVRNNDYLTMIYGVDFQNNFLHQLRKRSTKAKMNASISDWAINYKLLGVPYRRIKNDNYYYKNLMLDRILEEVVESRLDASL